MRMSQRRRKGQASIQPTGTSYQVIQSVRPSPGQHVTTDWWPAGTFKITTVAGSALGSYNVIASSIPSFATRFATLFDEYRILGVRFHVIPVCNLGTPNSGATVFVIDENDATAPASAAVVVQKRGSRILSNFPGARNRSYTFTWKAKDTTDEAWLSVSSVSTTSCALKFASDTTLAAPTASDIFIIQADLLISFRGDTP